MTQRGVQFNTFAGGHPDGTVKMEEVRLKQTIARHFLHLASRTHRLRTTGEAPDADGAPRILKELNQVKTFAVLPRGATRDRPHWLIELHFIEPLPPMGIEVADDFTIGVMRYAENRPDLDLRTHMADEKGVSRCHIRIEPDYETLYMTDLDSTNGTWINGVLIKPNQAHALQGGDVVSLAGLSFIVHIVSTPADLGSEQDAQ